MREKLKTPSFHKAKRQFKLFSMCLQGSEETRQVVIQINFKVANVNLMTKEKDPCS